jgi:hypothetical protein
MKLSTRLAGLGLIATAFASTPARAQLTSAGLDCHNGNAVTLMGAIACAGSFNGNNMNQQADVTAAMKSAFSSYTGSGSWWNYVGDPGFTGSTNGGIHFTSPVTGYFTIVLKSSNQFSMYLFNGGTSGIGSISFTDIGTSLNKQGVVQGLSHASLYSLNSAPPTTSTPEPSTVVLMGSGLLGLVAFRRRRRA